MPKQKAKSLADFRNTFDPDIIIPRRIATALAALLAEGDENWEYEADFMKRASISTTQVSRYRGPFENHVVEVRESGRNARRVWFASVKVADKARGA